MGTSKTSRGRGRYLGLASVVVVLAAIGLFTIGGRGSSGPDPSLLATVERGTMVVSVVATGKVEPITKVEVKSKANGIIEKLFADVDQVVAPGIDAGRTGQGEPDARACARRGRISRRPRRRSKRRARRFERTRSRPSLPMSIWPGGTSARAEQLFQQKLISQSGLDESRTALEQAENRRRASAGQVVIAQARRTEAVANVAQARAAVERAEEELAERHDPRAHPRHRLDARR